MAESLVTIEFKCVGKRCGKDAVVYCTFCKQMFCQSHQEFHDEFASSISYPHEVKLVEDYRRRIREAEPCLRDIHKPSVMAGCQSCYKPIHPKCPDDRTPENSTCPADGQDKHSSRSSDKVSLKIQREMKKMLSELRVKQLTHADDMKKRAETYDDVMKENRTDLDKLSLKVQQLHKKLDEFSDEISDGMVAHMGLKEEIMRKCESDYSEYQNNCKEIHDQTSEFFKLENEVVLKNQHMMRDKLEPLKSLQLEHQPLPPNLSIEFRDEHFKIPIKLIETPTVDKPTPNLSIEFRDEHFKIPISKLIKTRIVVTNTDGVPKRLKHKTKVDLKGIRAVQYLQDGCLIYAGDKSLLAGLDFTPDIPRGENVISLCEHKDNIYLLQYLQSDLHVCVHIIRLKDCSTQRSVLRSPGTNGPQQMAVNDNYIIFLASISGLRVLTVFSTQNFRHIFYLKVRHFTFEWIFGKAFLDDSLVIGDWEQHKVYNVTICSKSTVKWTRSIKQPTAIRVCSQVILVGSHSKRIHVLSHKGVKLSTIDAPQTMIRVADLYRLGNQLATVDDLSQQLHVYEITDED